MTLDIRLGNGVWGYGKRSSQRRTEFRIERDEDESPVENGGSQVENLVGEVDRADLAWQSLRVLDNID